MRKLLDPDVEIPTRGSVGLGNPPLIMLIRTLPSAARCSRHVAGSGSASGEHPSVLPLRQRNTGRGDSISYQRYDEAGRTRS
jgi:hypothetical protein